MDPKWIDLRDTYMQSENVIGFGSFEYPLWRRTHSGSRNKVWRFYTGYSLQNRCKKENVFMKVERRLKIIRIESDE